jgi:hypothetical protein
VNINEICYGVFFEARPFPGNDNLFIGCVRGSGIVFQCYHNEIFDSSRLKCVGIGGEEQTTTTTMAIDTTTSLNLDGVCENLFFDFIAHPSDCGKGIFCYNQYPILRECADGTIFDINIEK